MQFQRTSEEPEMAHPPDDLKLRRANLIDGLKLYMDDDRDRDRTDKPADGYVRIVALYESEDVHQEVHRELVECKAGRVVGNLEELSGLDTDCTRSAIFEDYKEVAWYPKTVRSLLFSKKSLRELAGRTVYLSYCPK